MELKMPFEELNNRIKALLIKSQPGDNFSELEQILIDVDNCLVDSNKHLNVLKENKHQAQEKLLAEKEKSLQLRNQLQDSQSCQITTDVSKEHLSTVLEHIKALERNIIEYAEDVTQLDNKVKKLTKNKAAIQEKLLSEELE